MNIPKKFLFIKRQFYYFYRPQYVFLVVLRDFVNSQFILSRINFKNSCASYCIPRANLLSISFHNVSGFTHLEFSPHKSFTILLIT